MAGLPVSEDSLQNSSGMRRRSREMALQLLFQREFLQQGEADRSLDEQTANRFAEHFKVEKEVADYGAELFIGVVKHGQEIDSLVQANSLHWRVARMGLVDLSVMRIAVFEMKFLEPRIGPSIAINEAVDLAKKYGSTESGAFVNGILDQFSMNL